MKNKKETKRNIEESQSILKGEHGDIIHRYDNIWLVQDHISGTQYTIESKELAKYIKKLKITQTDNGDISLI